MEQREIPDPTPRNGVRRGVNQFVDIRALDPDPYGRRHAVMKYATVVDVSISGASLCVTVDTEIVVGDVFELGVAGEWRTVQVIWVQPEGDDLLVCGVEFLQSDAEFLAALGRCLGRHADLLQAARLTAP